ncbi:MAG: hypothetical protein ACYSVY_21970 [Planctomycetota bacterium]|jgi:hypothetical protein
MKYRIFAAALVAAAFLTSGCGEPAPTETALAVPESPNLSAEGFWSYDAYYLDYVDYVECRDAYVRFWGWVSSSGTR